MAGEIRERLTVFREGKKKLLAALDGSFADASVVFADGHEAVKMVEAEVAAVKTEINDLRGEFKGATNGPPLDSKV